MFSPLSSCAHSCSPFVSRLCLLVCLLPSPPHLSSSASASASSSSSSSSTSPFPVRLFRLPCRVHFSFYSFTSCSTLHSSPSAVHNACSLCRLTTPLQCGGRPYRPLAELSLRTQYVTPVPSLSALSAPLRCPLSRRGQHLSPSAAPTFPISPTSLSSASADRPAPHPRPA